MRRAENTNTAPILPDEETRSQLAARLGVSIGTVARAYRELADMGIIYLVPGHGYYPKVKGLR